jgi:predicted nucleic acid-binding protein
MTGPSAAEVAMPPAGIALYVDSSALAKLYVPEADSDRTDAFLRGRTGMVISELAITEVLSAVARKGRAGELEPKYASQIRDALIADAESGSFERVHLDPATHREAERLLAVSSVPLRTLDALHLALATVSSATHILTFDLRMREAAVHSGLIVVEL